MSGRRIGAILAVLVVVLLAAALFDGGKEPLHPIEQELELPEGGR